MLGLNKNGEEAALVYQFAGGSSGKEELPPGGAWKCFHLSRVSDARWRNGPRYGGARHISASSCLAIVDLDINPNSPYHPTRKLTDLRFD
jgi:hypothetical protein